MKNNLYRAVCAIFLTLFLQPTLKAQLLVDNSLTPTQLAQLISGSGVIISNPVVHCGLNGYGKYNATNSNLNITEGLILTTGTTQNAVGPNNVANKTTYFGSQNTPDTYPMLTNITGRTIYEYCEFEFDIVPQGDTISFDFVFASEEYEEWVGSQYNDVFGFFISGPGITPDANAAPYHNIALIPNTSTAITINNVNQNQHTQYYQNNNNGTSVQYDGFTRGLKAISHVTPCQTYHLKLIVADASDKLWDSGVFIEKIKSNNILLLSHTAGGIPNMVEGCNNGTVSFTRQTVTNQPLLVTYFIGGTATNGTDYPLIGSSPSPSSPKYITIPANQATASININPYADAINEGYEFMTVYLGNPYCSNIIMDSLRFYIQDSLYTTIAPTLDSLCIGNGVQLTTTGGGSAFIWSPSAGLNNANISNPFASPTVTTTYTLTTTASTCVKQKSTIIRISNIALSFNANNVSCNGSNNGSITVNPTGGFPPYTYVWTGPSSFTANTATISNLAPGTYSVTVTGRRSCSTTGICIITQPSVLTSTVSSPTVNGAYNIACNGGATGSATVVASGGTSPYTYSWSTAPVQTSATATGLIAGTYTVTVHDAHNCVSTSTIALTQPALVTGTITASTNVLCYGNNTGSATVSPSGGTPSYTYSWNTIPIQSTATATNLGSGTYTVTIQDANNCNGTKTVSITQPTAALSGSITAQTNVLCRGNNTGSATVTATGGTGVYTYSWNTLPVQTTATANNLAAGNYVVTIHDANNCTANVPVTINQPASSISASVTSQINVLCFGNNSGSATVTASGGSPGYTYSWTTLPLQTTATASNLSAGSYTCTVRDANLCTTTASVIITQPAAILLASVTGHTNVLCYGNNSGSATASASGGRTPYSYSWNTIPIQTTAIASNLSVGNYTVTVTDANSCTSTATVSITQPATAISASLTSQTNVYCFGGNSGSAGVTATGGTSPYTYSWNTLPVQTNATATSLSAGTYSCTIKDLNNCTITVSVAITQPSSALSATITSTTNVMCRNNSTGSATVTASGGSGSYTYSWNSIPIQTTAIANNLPAGSYTVTVTDNNGCTVPVSATTSITQPAAILSATSSSPTFNGYNISCNGGHNGSITITPSGGTAPYTYAWTGPVSFTSTLQNISGLIAGTYSLTVTDAHGCTTTLTTTLTQPTLLGLTSSVTNATCLGASNGAINITVTGGTLPYSYAWSGPSSFSATTEDISALAFGNYSITITDANGCTAYSTITVAQPSTLLISNTPTTYPGGTNISCNGGNNGGINVTVTGGVPFPGPSYLFTWTGPSGYTSSSQNISGLLAGTYQLIVTDQNGCNANSIVTLSEPAAIIATLTPSIFIGGNNISCNGASTGSINTSTVGGTSPYTYSWSGPSSYTSSSQNISSLLAGTYTVSINDLNSCIGTNTITLSQPLPLTASATSPVFAGGFNISCNGTANGSIALTVSGGSTNYTFAWTGPASYVSTQQNPNNLVAGSYNVLVIDANGCTTTASIILTQPAILTTNATSPTVFGGYNLTCHGAANGSINLSTNGGTAAYTFAWSGPASFTSTNQNPTGLIAGTYSVLVTDANGCTTNTSITLTEPAILTSTASSPTFAGGFNITCNGANNGAINLNVTGGTSTYSYLWSGPASFAATSQNLTGLFAGTYSVNVTDANGCTSTASIVLTQPASLLASVSSPIVNGGYNITCHGSGNGSIIMNVNGGTPTYTYAWTGPSGFTSTNQNISSLFAGTYNVTITDQNGCITTSTITLTEPSIFSGTITSPTFNGGYNISCHGNSNGNITISPTGGTTSYTYIWSNGATTQNLSNVPAGYYSVISSDANNCTFTLGILLTEPGILNAVPVSPTFLGGYNLRCHGSNDGSINLGVGGGTSPYVFSWTGPSGFTATTEDLSGLIAGTYSVTVTDNNSCSTSNSITLSEPNTLTVSLTSPTFLGAVNVSCHGNNDGAIHSTVIGGTPGFIYLWNGPSGFTASTANISSLIAGTYTLTATDINGCSATATITLIEPAILSGILSPSIVAGGYNISCNGSSNGTISLTPTGGTSPFNYSWTGPNNFASTNQNISGLIVGTYSVTIHDANGCDVSLTQIISEPPSIADIITPSLFAGQNNISCHDGTNGAISLAISGGTNPYSQNWTGPNGFTSNSNSLSGLEAGNYIVTITDANSCTKTDNITLVQPDLLTSTLTSPTYVGGYNIKCHADTTGVIDNLVAGGTSAFTFSWTGPNGFTASTQDLFNVIAGTYTANVIDANGCTTYASITLNQAPNPMAGNLSAFVYPGGTNISCFGSSNGSIDLTYTGGIAGFTYWWRGPGNFSSSTEDISGVPAGHYEVVVTDTNGCQLPLAIDLIEPSSPLTDSISVSLFGGNVNVSCNGSSNGSIDLFPNGGSPSYTYSWNGPSSYSSTNQNINNLSAGIYYLTITDMNSCIVIDTVQLIEPSPITSSITSTPASCIATNGTADLTVTGGVTPYNYVWSNASTNQDLIAVASGMYAVLITDENECTHSDSIFVDHIFALAITSTVNNANCFGNADGSVNLTLLGGTVPISYTWSNGANTEDISNLFAGTYIVAISDASGCSLSDTFNISQPTQLVISLSSPILNGNYNISSYSGTDGSITCVVNGGTSPYNYWWSNNTTNQNPSNLGAGYYTVIVTDNAGCKISDTILLTEPLELALPSGISPNGDGLNDYFIVHGLDVFPENTLTVFNRWGNEVFKKDDYRNDWNGINTNGDALPDGTYFIILEIADTKTQLTGYVDIRR
ncbi:MAG: choice-of-anchor L domain-containing protein [Bacteroidetes bacterium]|nr:choice-of-anchor L domain-containing protein [Bacteroidota bacterium]